MARMRTTLVFIIAGLLFATLASCPPDQLDRDGGTGNVRKGDATVDASNSIEKFSTTIVAFPTQDL